jgi:ABC-type phosphate transport system substrate-binding protein
MKTNTGTLPLSTKLAIPGFAILALAAASWMTFGARPANAAGDPVVVIVNASNPVDNLSLGELKKLFLSDRSRWDTGKAVAPVMVAAGAPERVLFLKIVCGMNDADLGKYFMQAAFTGKSATPPKEVGSAGAVKSFVASSPGAIGFVKAVDFHGDGSDGGIKSVKIDGAVATDAGYKLKM